MDTALLVLDAAGKIRMANNAAGRLWQTSAGSLAGQPVVSLFAFEVVSSDPSWQESQWEVLIATSLGRPLTLEAQPFEPVAPINVRIELQAAQGDAAGYFARIELLETKAAASASAVGGSAASGSALGGSASSSATASSPSAPTISISSATPTTTPSGSPFVSPAATTAAAFYSAAASSAAASSASTASSFSSASSACPLSHSAHSGFSTAPLADALPLLAAKGSVGFFDVDVVSGKVTTSPAWKKMLGYTSEEIADTQAAFRALVHPDDTSALPDAVTKPPLSTSRDFSVEFRLKHRSGHYIWVQSNGIQLFNTERVLQRVIGINVDITERKEIEEHGIAAEDRLNRLGEDGSLAVFDIDFTTAHCWFSPAWNDVVGEDANAIHHDDDDGETQHSIDAFLRALPESESELGAVAFLTRTAPAEPFFTRALTLRKTDGGELPVVLAAHRQWSRKRELVRAVGVILPMPSGAGEGPVPSLILPGLLNTISEAVLVTDARAQVVYLNEKAAELTGIPLSTARDLKLGDVFKLVRRSDGKPDESAVDLVLAAEEKPRLYAEHALVSTSGDKPAPIIWTVRQITTPENTTGAGGIVVVFRNPSEMTLTPEEIIRANRFDSLGQLAGGIAHDFNNLLTTILGGISTAKDNRDYSKLEDAESACMAAKALTRQLLTFAKGNGSGPQQIVATKDILTDAVRIAAAGTTAVVSIQVPDGTAPLRVDRGQINQVFQNLIINSLQAMPDVSKGRVELRANNVNVAAGDVPPLAAGGYVQIEVQDNGSGIPASHIEKIFEPFYTTKKTGTGLGLATVLSIVRQHGGQIGVDSTVGKGTTFTLFFPQADAPVEVAQRSAPAIRFGTGRVLFLDDDPKICELTAGMLTSLDYTHDIVRKGEDAITFYRRYLNVGRPYDAVILDLNVVGGMGGEECFKQLRALHPEVRAIVNSGYDSEEMARQYLDMGFVGYLTKPYRVGDLGRVLKTALGKG